MARGMSHEPAQSRSWVRPMLARDPAQPHRVSTPLELLYDLCFVVAVAHLSDELRHGLAEGHFLQASVSYFLVFIAIWWAWMNFAWFASAYDTDDVPYRLKVLLQIAGVLVLASGVEQAFVERDFRVVTLGFSITRAAMILQWLRAARAAPQRRKTALRFAAGLGLCQLGWIALAFAPHQLWIYGWFVLMPAELAVPLWAESAGATPWHPGHIAERYALFTLIVIGESVLSSTEAFGAARSLSALTLELAGLGIGGMLIFFAMWWLYFSAPMDHLLTSNRAGFLWGYGHFWVLGAAAATGAGLGLLAERASGHAHLSAAAAGAALALPIALFVLGVGLLQRRWAELGLRALLGYLGFLTLLFFAAPSPWAALLFGLGLSLLVVLAQVGARSAQAQRVSAAE
jgi:low temperature requirement protein LtrA